MKLTEEQLEIIRAVRQRMNKKFRTDGAESYICWNILIAVTGKTDCLYTGIWLGLQLQEAGESAHQLWLAIEEALEDFGTMENYVVHKIQDATPSGKYNPRLRFGLAPEYAAQARLAWLDRIVETGEIA